jgi:imidazolonepropionase-like amidohydrolase
MSDRPSRPRPTWRRIRRPSLVRTRGPSASRTTFANTVVGLALTSLGLLVAAAPAAAVAPPSDTTAVAFVGATVIDGNGGPPATGMTLVVEGARIAALGPAGEVTIPQGAHEVDASGRFLLPGFIDTNVHISLYSGGETMVRYVDRNAELAIESAQLHLKHGITTVRDSYGSFPHLLEAREAIASGEREGARILMAGNIVGWGGPCSVSFSLVRESECTLFQEEVNDMITQGTGEELMHMTPEELRVAINDYLDLGPDFIKFGGTGHFNPVFIGFSPEAQRAMVEETHRRGLIAETHSTSIEGLRLSVEAGIDLIQHPEILARREIPDWLVDEIREREVICSMLTNTITGEVWQDHLAAEERREGGRDEREEALQGRERTSAEVRREESGMGMEMRRRNAEKLIAGGCISTVGTDNYLGNAPEFRRSPKPENQEAGIGTIIGIEGLVELGMTPSEALVAATRNGAIASGMLDEIGTLEVGKLADVLLLGADPLQDIGNIRTVEMVLKEGRIVELESLPTHPVWYGR